MKIYLAMVFCNDWREDGGGEYALDKAFTSDEEAMNYAHEVAKNWCDEEEQEEGYYEGFTKEIELKGIKYLVLPIKG